MLLLCPTLVSSRMSTKSFLLCDVGATPHCAFRMARRFWTTSLLNLRTRIQQTKINDPCSFLHNLATQISEGQSITRVQYLRFVWTVSPAESSSKSSPNDVTCCVAAVLPGHRAALWLTRTHWETWRDNFLRNTTTKKQNKTNRRYQLK